MQRLVNGHRGSENITPPRRIDISIPHELVEFPTKTKQKKRKNKYISTRIGRIVSANFRNNFRRKFQPLMLQFIFIDVTIINITEKRNSKSIEFRFCHVQRSAFVAFEGNKSSKLGESATSRNCEANFAKPRRSQQKSALLASRRRT